MAVRRRRISSRDEVKALPNKRLVFKEKEDIILDELAAWRRPEERERARQHGEKGFVPGKQKTRFGITGHVRLYT